MISRIHLARLKLVVEFTQTHQLSSWGPPSFLPLTLKFLLRGRECIKDAVTNPWWQAWELITYLEEADEMAVYIFSWNTLGSIGEAPDMYW